MNKISEQCSHSTWVWIMQSFWKVNFKGHVPLALSPFMYLVHASFSLVFHDCYLLPCMSLVSSSGFLRLSRSYSQTLRLWDNTCLAIYPCTICILKVPISNCHLLINLTPSSVSIALVGKNGSSVLSLLTIDIISSQQSCL